MWLSPLKNNVIEAVDILDGQVWTRFGLPKAPMYHFHAGQLSDDDFVLRGLRLNQHFVNDADAEWRTQGMLFGATFIGYNEYGVSVDDKSLINRVLLKRLYTNTSWYCHGRYKISIAIRIWYADAYSGVCNKYRHCNGV